ncbi:hypothetical protein Acsp02_90050 [Actinoplanes sp. NBRC 103695]|nr:hypothetical protein Acsp02_90050 [Actinoplanes sp. NBRC 103695]
MRPAAVVFLGERVEESPQKAACGTWAYRNTADPELKPPCPTNEVEHPAQINARRRVCPVDGDVGNIEGYAAVHYGHE